MVDFGPKTDLEASFGLQQRYNSPGRSAPLCSEYYTGWLTHWGEQMANTSTEAIAESLKEILEYGGGTGSMNLYMAHGGTNFGFWAGGCGAVVVVVVCVVLLWWCCGGAEVVLWGWLAVRQHARVQL